LGIDFGAGAAGGVDGFLVLLRCGGGSFLAEDDGFPILRNRSHTGHVCLCLCLVLEWLCLGFVVFVRQASMREETKEDMEDETLSVFPEIIFIYFLYFYLIY